MYLGIDVHKHNSTVAVLPEDPTDNEPIEERSVPNEQLEEIAVEYAGSKAVLEATSNYFTIYDRLSQQLDVTLANPLELDWITEDSQKTDEIDATKLASLLKVDMVPESYVPSKEIRRWRELTRSRQRLVEDRTKWKNEIHSLLDHHGIVYDGADLFSESGREFLRSLELEPPGELLIEQYLSLVDDLTEKQEAIDTKIAAAASDVAEVQLLVTIPGVGPYRALVMHAELGDVDRFDTKSAVVSYAGLDPTVHESADSRSEGSISKQGNSHLRKVVVNAAQTAVHTSKDRYLTNYYNRLRYAKDKPALVARVATGRKLLISAYFMLKRGEQYDPPG
jgi:transposase